MKKIVLVLLTILSISTLAEAKINSITLYYDGALIECEELVIPDNEGKLTFILPKIEGKNTNFEIVGHEIVSTQTSQIPVGQTAKVIELQEQRVEILKKAEELNFQIDEEDWKSSFLSEQLVALSNLQNQEEQYQSFTVKLAELRKRALELRLESYQNDEEILDINEEINYWLESGLEQIELTVELKQAVKEPVKLVYSYYDRASWKPSYKILASEEQVELILEAKIDQNSYSDWQAIPTTLMAYSFDTNTYLPRPHEWIIFDDKRPMPRALAQAAPANAMFKQDAMSAESSQAIVQTEQENAVAFQNLSLSCASQNQLTVVLTKESIPAKILRLAVPYSSSEVYLSAILNLDPNKYYLPAEADIFYDNTIVAQDYINLSSKNNRLSLGLDHLVVAKMDRLDEQSGKAGFIDKRQTYVWDWQIEIVNKHSFPIAIQIEDAAPQSQIQGLELQVKSKPEAILDDNIYIWNLDIPANSKDSIRQSVNLNAPADVQIFKGR